MSATSLKRIALPATALLALASCATSRPQAQVTRFHIGAPVAAGSVSVEAAQPGLGQSLEFQTYAGAVAGELARIGYTPQPVGASTDSIAVLDVQQRVRAGEGRRSSISFGFGVGGGSFGRRSAVGGGVGTGFSVPVGNARAADMVDTLVNVRLLRRSDRTIFWEGRAEGSARGDSPLAQPVNATRALAAAMFKGYPGQTGQTVRVTLQ